MTTVWSIQAPASSYYAQLNNLWIDRPFDTCVRCGRRIYKPVDHIEVEWEEGSDQIGDFTFALGALVLKAQVADDLLNHFGGFRKGEVRLPDHPNLRRSARSTNRTAKRVWLPYEGPPLCYMAITVEIEFHPDSIVEVEASCEECGMIIYKRFDGIEKRNSHRHVTRERGRGFFFDMKSLGDGDFFRPRHTGFTLCTDEARVFIMEKGYSNVEFLEVGELKGVPV